MDNEVFVKKVTETQSTLDTNPSNYIGYEIDPLTGKRKKKGKDGEDDMSDKELHADAPPDGPAQPTINVQAEAYKPGFVISLVEEPLDEAPAKAAPKAGATKTSSDTASKTATKTSTKTATKTSTDAYTQGNITVTGGAGAGATSVTINIPRGDGGDPAKKAGDANPHKKTKNNAESVDALKTLNHMHHLCEAYPQVKMVWEDTTTGEKGYVTPAMFVKVYSKMLQENIKKKEPTPMSESYTKHANLPLANELMNIGLVNNVKGTAKVLKEGSPMRQAMEIFYTSEKANADADEKKSAYVPSQLKEGKMVLEKNGPDYPGQRFVDQQLDRKGIPDKNNPNYKKDLTPSNLKHYGKPTNPALMQPAKVSGNLLEPIKPAKIREQEVTPAPKPKRLIIW
jgi:hypothetical protein